MKYSMTKKGVAMCRSNKKKTLKEINREKHNREVVHLVILMGAIMLFSILIQINLSSNF